MKFATAARAACAAICLLPLVAQSAERLGRLSMELKVTGTETMRNGSDHATTQIAQSIRLSTAARSDGELVSINTKVPDFAQKMQAQAAAQEARTREVQAMQQRYAQNQRAQGAVPPQMAPVSQADMMAKMHAMQARCGTDPQCLMNEATKMSAQQVAGYDAALQKRLEGHGAERAQCERDFAKDARKRAACLDAAEIRAGGTGGDNYEAEADLRYLNFYGFDNCGAQVSATIDDRTSGRYEDVQGMVPYTVTRKADWKADATQARIVCTAYNPVLDVKARTITTDGLVLPEVRGRSTRSDRGRTASVEEALPLRSEALVWASEQLRQAPASGTRKTTLPIKSTTGQGTVEGNLVVELSWRFE
ncbi:MAG: hypothetical protein U5L03_08950 [Burkholderiaceae bacterium]|nr:hypothetical protein [Burkholderiaceae bacterium]